MLVFPGLLLCIALIIAILCILIIRTVKKSQEQKQAEEFYNKCKMIQMGMVKNQVISIMGYDFTFSCDLYGEYYRWEKKLAKNELTLSVTFNNECVVAIEVR